MLNLKVNKNKVKVFNLVIVFSLIISGCSKMNTISKNIIHEESTVEETTSVASSTSKADGNENSNISVIDNEETRKLESVELSNYHNSIAPTVVNAGDIFLEMKVKNIDHTQRKINGEWVTTYASIKFENEIVLSGELIYGEPTFFLPDEESYKKIPRLYYNDMDYRGILFSNGKDVMDFLEENYADNYNNQGIYVSEAVFENFTIVLRSGIGNEDSANLLSIDLKSLK